LARFVLVCVRTFCFSATSSSRIYTLSLHDALPIYDFVVICAPEQVEVLTSTCMRLFDEGVRALHDPDDVAAGYISIVDRQGSERDRKSTRLNSSHDQISYAVFCLKKKKT